MGERLREVAELAAGVRVDLLGVELQRAGVRQQLLALRYAVGSRTAAQLWARVRKVMAC